MQGGNEIAVITVEKKKIKTVFFQFSAVITVKNKNNVYWFCIPVFMQIISIGIGYKKSNSRTLKTTCDEFRLLDHVKTQPHANKKADSSAGISN